ncbi:MAG: hypothetical protein GXX99_05720 [Clostridiales bacterium]|nr:hypothetical protein [Clostridiales bacterium]
MRFGRLYVSPLLLLILLFFIAVDASIYAPLIILAAAFHEMGHLSTLKKCGLDVQEVNLHPFGVEIVVEGLRYLPYHDELAVAASGPLVNLLVAVVTTLVVLLTGPFDGALFFIVVNLALALLNLMPIQGLDGGRILEALLMPRMSLDRAERTLKAVSGAASALVFVAGLWLLYKTRYNFSLAMIGCYLLARKSLRDNADPS